MEGMVWILVPLAAIIGGITYAIVKTKEFARVRELEIRERIAMIEKGLVPPPEKDPHGFEHAMDAVDRVGRRFHGYDDGEFYGRARSPERHRSAGITLMGVGFGLMFMIGFAAHEPGVAIGVGGFLVLLGIAFFVNAIIERRERRRTDGSRPTDLARPASPPPDTVSR